MASSGSSGRAASGSRSFDFASDDVLCSYDDLGHQDPSNGKLPDSSAKDFRECRTGRPLVNVYSQQEEFSKQDVISSVEKCMKKYADNLLRFLEGISGRLSQLELYCYNLERSIGDFQADLVRGQGEADQKLKSLEKHLQEVHRSVQILRDKQELADTQKELAKLQLAQKESTKGVTSASGQKRQDDLPDASNQQLALALPRQTTVSTSLPAMPVEQNQPHIQQPAPSVNTQQHDPYTVNQAGNYTHRSQMLSLPPVPQPHQLNQPLQSELQYAPQRPQTQDLTGQQQAPQQQQQPPVLNQPEPHTYLQYQQQWPQQSSQQSSQQFPHQPVQPQQQGNPHAQVRPQAVGPMYPTYASQPPANVLPETYQGSMPTQVPYSVPQSSGNNRSEAVPFGYGGPGGVVLQQPTGQGSKVPPPSPPHHHSIPHQPPQTSQGYMTNKSSYAGNATYPAQSNMQGYMMMYGNDGSRTVHPQNFLHPGSYQPTGISSLQNQQSPPTVHHSGSQLQQRNHHPYAEVIEKAVSMGYPRDQAASMVLRMEESGQPVDLNVLLDRLNARVAGASQRGWSG